jgi:hypothetical protein
VDWIHLAQDTVMKLWGFIEGSWNWSRIVFNGTVLLAVWCTFWLSYQSVSQLLGKTFTITHFPLCVWVFVSIQPLFETTACLVCVQCTHNHIKYVHCYVKTRTLWGLVPNETNAEVSLSNLRIYPLLYMSDQSAAFMLKIESWMVLVLRKCRQLGSSETPVNFSVITQRHISEDCNLHSEMTFRQNSLFLRLIVQICSWYFYVGTLSYRWRLRRSSDSHAGLWFPSSRVQTRPKPLDFFCVKNPQHAFLRGGS